MLRVKDWTLFALLCVHANAASVYTCKEGEKVSSVLQCSDYFVCKDVDLVKETCPTGELYDSDAETCRDAHKVDCIDVLLGRHHQHSLNSRRSKESHSKDSKESSEDGPHSSKNSKESDESGNNKSSGATGSNSNEWSSETTTSTSEVSSEVPSTATSPISTNGTEATPSTPQTTTAPTTTTLNPAIGCQGTCPANNIEPTFYPHSDCSKYCQCDHGFPFVMDCPPGLHFNPSDSVCDYPENVDCPY